MCSSNNIVSSTTGFAHSSFPLMALTSCLIFLLTCALPDDVIHIRRPRNSMVRETSVLLFVSFFFSLSSTKIASSALDLVLAFTYRTCAIWLQQPCLLKWHHHHTIVYAVCLWCSPLLLNLFKPGFMHTDAAVRAPRPSSVYMEPRAALLTQVAP